MHANTKKGQRKACMPSQRKDKERHACHHKERTKKGMHAITKKGQQDWEEGITGV